MTTQTVTSETKSAQARRTVPETKVGSGMHPSSTAAYGNQALLRMRGLGMPLLQRECACGGSGESGAECVECKEKHEKSQRGDRQAAFLQTKLAINESGDRYEQDADQVAGRVLSTPDRGIPGLQRVCAE